MTAVQVVKFPGSTRVVLGDEALALVAEALEWTADNTYTPSGVEARRLHLLAEAVRASRDVALNMEDVDQDAGRSIASDMADAWGKA